MTGRYCIVAIVQRAGRVSLDIRYTNLGDTPEDAGARYARNLMLREPTTVIEYAVFSGTASLQVEPVKAPPTP